MSAAPAAARFTPRNVQVARAVVAAVAALMISFSSDHSYVIGLTVFSGFATLTALVLGFAAGFVDDRTRRPSYVLLAVVSGLAAILASIAPLRSTMFMFVLFLVWLALSGLVELLFGLADRRAGRDRMIARDGVFMGVLGLIAAIAIAVVPPAYSYDYVVEDAGQTFTLTGSILIVGLFGGYAAIAAVFLGIAGLSPQQDAAPVETDGGDAADSASGAAAAGPSPLTHHEKDPA